MSKVRTVFYCSNCGAQAAKWIGKCPSCNEWNTYVEEVIEREKSATPWKKKDKHEAAKPKTIQDIKPIPEERIITPDNELNRVLGGGIVPGSVILVGGEPGIGKSTLLLQLALRMEGVKVLYLSGEESDHQIRMRAERIGTKNKECYILPETSTALIFRHIQELQPEVVIVDSIQTMQTELVESTAGSISQIRECAGEFQRYAKESGVPVFLIGHITKEGIIAGPKILEHMVDTVLQFEGDRHYSYRILRTVKNRFGSTSELGIYEMQGSGLSEVSNPSEILLTQRDEMLSGIAISATMEGMRPLLVETQALVTQAVYGTPQRTTTGFDLQRMRMLLAVLEKRCGFFFGVKDVFLNIAGGIRVEDPAIDLAVVASILSSYEDKSLAPNICFCGEVGLSGEIRAVNRIEQRISESAKLGFEKIFVSGYNKKGLNSRKLGIEVVLVNKVEDLIRRIL
ncbi:MAG: DNA repair protein RadA [Sphingobacteriales bacterium]|nr:MAG: DNA repair protein RadA [Sphingobacteriales bacterium]